MGEFISGLFCSNGLFVSPCTNTTRTSLLQLYNKFGYLAMSALCFSKIAVAITGLFIFYIHFIFGLCIFTITETVSNLYIYLERNNIFTILSLPVYEYNISEGAG